MRSFWQLSDVDPWYDTEGIFTFQIAANGGALERVTDGAASDRLRSVSEDGRTLVFISSRTGRDEVWSKDLETSIERQVTERGAMLAQRPFPIF
jgi:Tol biopolymer transport system component